MAVRIQVRRGTTSQWNTADPILNEGEIGYNSTLGQIKIGDGTSAWSALDYMATDAQLNSSLSDYIAIIEKGAADGVAELNADKNVLTQSSIIFEGATTNSYQTTVTVVDPTADRTITIPNADGTFVVADGSGDVVISGNLTVNGTTTTIDTQNLQVEDKNIILGYGATSDTAVDGGGITLTGSTNKTFNWVDATDSWTSSENLNLASGKTVKINGTDVLSSSQVLGKSLPTGDVVGTSDTQILSGKTISGTSNTITNIANSSLDNSAITINGTPVSLGGTITIAGDIESVSAGTGLTGGGTSGAVTLSVDTTVVATTNNTLTMSNKTLTSPVVTGLTLNDSSIVFEGSTEDSYETTLTVTNPTADRTITLPDNSGTVITTGDAGTVTSTMIANGTIVNEDINASAAIDKTKIAGTAITAADTGTVSNTMLANNSLTIGSTNVSLGGSTTSLAGLSSVTATTFTGNLSGNANTVTNGVYTTDTGTVTSTMIADGTIVNADINASAGIDKTKIAGTAVTQADTGTVTSTMIADGTIVNDDINASANIAVSKLAANTISGVTLGNNLNALTIGTGLSGTSYNGSTSVTVAIDSTVATTSGTQTLTNKSISLANNTLTGTLAEFNTALSGADFATLAGAETLTNKTLNSGTSLGADLSAATYKITNLGTPSSAADAATKQYVDDVAQGLHIHASCVAATTSNINLNNQLENGDVLDGVTLATGNRVLVKNQNTTADNGVYIVQANGAAVRATDFDTPAEIHGGDFIFVTGGTVNDNTGWVQTEIVTTVGTSPILFQQFSGAGTYQAGTGLTLTGNIFSINTATTVDLSTAQTLSNKTISLGSNTVSGTVAQFNTALTDGDFATLAGTETLTGKTINGANNTLTVRLANDISGFGTGVATALGVNTGSAGAFVVNGGALGTPSSATLTNATGLPVTSGISGLGTGVATFLATPSSANLISAITDETGTGSLVFGTSPAITTSLTTPSTSFSLVNTTATTVNFAGAATTLSIGATSGTTTINNDVSLGAGKSYKINGTNISAALPALTWGDVKNGKSGLTIS